MQINEVLMPLTYRGKGCIAALYQALEDRHADRSLGGKERIMLL